MEESVEPDAPLGAVDGAAPSAAAKRRRRNTNAQAKSATAPPETLVAALIIAHDQARRIAATVRAARAIPGVDLVLVVDDGSTDNTQDLARKAGAVVVRHSHHRGRAEAAQTGASVIAMRDEPGAPPRAILLLDGALGNYAIGAAQLVPAVTESVADLAIGLTVGGNTAAGVSSAAARKAIERASHWVPRQPLSRIRCMTREALEAALPLARGDGLEVGMTLDVLHAGLLVSEVECEIRHKPIRKAKRTPTQRLKRLRDVQMAIGARRARAMVSTTTGAVVNALPFGGSTEIPTRSAEAKEPAESNDPALNAMPAEPAAPASAGKPAPKRVAPKKKRATSTPVGGTKAAATKKPPAASKDSK
ncbi:glycosyltransferase family 2 protein [Demequina oxidasica]|uniref:glycosyltransferase family 2 protein n=1 Tax=Demequina oxidasica TaxID=676199 RepID=UPI000A01EAE7|nr:glycosyltransferase [Demequina oxidasica]